MSTQESIQTFVKQLAPDSCVITVNQRLASRVRQAYDYFQQQQGLTTWASITIQPLNTWLNLCWHQLGHPQLLLNPQQEQALWRQVIHQHSAEQIPYLHLEATAQLAQQAWQLIHQWQLALSELEQQHYNEQISCFLTWAQHFQHTCQQQQWLSSAEVPQHLLIAMQETELTLPAVSSPSAIFLVGFDELSPLLQQLVLALQHYCAVSQVQFGTLRGQCQRISLNDASHEISSFIAWSKQLLEQNPKLYIGCIIPDLANCRRQVANELNNAFAIQNKLPGMANTLLPYNISAGQSLFEFEAIYIALQSLALLHGTFDIDSIGILLQSPYLILNPYDTDLGALLDKQLREHSYSSQLPLEILFDPLNALLTHFPQQTWLKRWQLLCQGRRQQLEHCLPSQWAHYFCAQLNAIGWPGYRALNSMEYQLLQRWQQLLDEMAYFDPICGSITLEDALQLLHSTTQQTLFQAQGNAEAPIQVLGLLESTGYQFDALWVMGLHDEAWPPAATPNPFLPFALQQRLQMPHASAQRQLQYTQQINQRLLHSAKHIILSSPQRQGEKLLRSSRIIEAIPEITFEDLALPNSHNYTQIIFSQQRLETIDDQFAPALAANTQVRGGSWILTEQATCPFRAFALIRLRAEALPNSHYLLSGKHRGTLLHHSLALLWSKLLNQTTLLQFSDHDLQSLIKQSIESAITAAFNVKQQQALQQLLQIEVSCLQELILQWLQLEKQRTPFHVIACEHSQTIQLRELSLNLKIDRIDELSNGQRMIIDYKTGQQLSIQSWFGGRLKQPQLPLYSLCELQTEVQPNTFAPSSHSSITFAQIRADEMQFKGICAENLPNPLGDLKGIIPINRIKTEDNLPLEWQHLQQDWQQSLTNLADTFIAGDARLDPIDGDKTCQQCELQGLCHVRRGMKA